MEEPTIAELKAAGFGVYDPNIIEGQVLESREEIITLPSERDLLLAIVREQEKTNELLSDLREAANSQSGSLNWLTENTAGLFATIAQMNAAGGPMALLGMMKGGN